jgi:hypothetical protein
MEYCEEYGITSERQDARIMTHTEDAYPRVLTGAKMYKLR